MLYSNVILIVSAALTLAALVESAIEAVKIFCTLQIHDFSSAGFLLGIVNDVHLEEDYVYNCYRIGCVLAVLKVETYKILAPKNTDEE